MRVLKGKSAAVTGLAFSPDGATLAAASSSRVDFWNPTTETCDALEMGIWGVPPDNARFDPSGRWLLAGFGFSRGLCVIKVQTRAVERVGKFDVNHLAVSRTGTVLVGGGGVSAFGVTKKGLSARKWAKDLSGYQLAGLDAFPDGTQFATVERKYRPGSVPWTFATRVRVRATRNGRLIREAESDGPQATPVRVSPDGEWIAFTSAKFLVLHHGTELTRSVRVPTPGKKPVTGLAFHPSGRYLAATSSDATVRLHDRDANWAVTRTFDWRIGGLRSVAFHPEGTLAAAGGEKGQVVLWDVDL